MRALVSPLCGVLVAVIAGLLGGWRGHGLGPATAYAALLAGVASAVLVWRSLPAGEKVRPKFWDWAMGAAWTIAVLRAFLWLIADFDGQLRVLSPNNLGDMALHLDFIRYFASGIAWWPASPILSGELLKYPAGADLFNALLALAGVDVLRGLIWVGLLGGLLSGYALWRWGGAFALAAFLFAGGLAGFAVLGGAPVGDLQAELAWKNLFLSMLVTQRGLLYALPAGLALMISWRMRLRTGDTGDAPLPRWIEVALYSTMPLFSPHTFLFLSLLLPVLFAFSPRGTRLGWIALVAASVVPATCALALVTAGFSTAGMVRYLPGWMMKDGGIGFWVWNFGISLPLAAVACVAVARGGNRADRAFTWGGAAVFLLGVFVCFAPWEWDNIKILVWAWLAVAPCIWSSVLAPLPRPASATLCLVLFFSGAVSLVGGLDGRHGYELASSENIDKTARLIGPLDRSGRFACAPEYNHPLLLLGRPVAVGYDGHLWSHGLDYMERARKLEVLMNGWPDWRERARDLGVRYLFWSQIEMRRYPNSSRPWERGTRPAASGSFAVIYDLGDLIQGQN